MTILRSRRGFTLVELAVVLAVIGMVIAILPMAASTVDATKQGATSKKLDTIELGLMAYRAAYNRLPCPADPTLAASNANYGMEAGTAGSCTGGAIQLDLAHQVVEGAVPVKQLGLPAEFMYDAWGHKIAYAVNQNVTAAQAMSGQSLSEQCGITVTDAGGGNRTTGAAYVLVSYGQDGHGSYDINGNRINAGSTNSGEQTNCHCDASAAETTYAASYVEKNRTEDSSSQKNLFDDQVRFKERWQMLTPDDMYATGGSPVCSQGFILPGQAVYDLAGEAVAFGDVNGDGIPDMVVAFASSTWWKPAIIYVVFGTKNGFADPLVLPGKLNGSNGFAITNMSLRQAGFGIAVGDVNGDGHPDIVINMNGGTGGLQHALFVIFGHDPSYSWPATIDVTTLNGTNGGVFTMATSYGWSPVAIGDVNGDGIADIVMGDQEYGINNPDNGLYEAGVVYVLFGHTGAWQSYASPLDYTALNGTNGFKINGQVAAQGLGSGVAVGDLNGDGIADIAFYEGCTPVCGYPQYGVIFGQKLGTSWGAPWPNPFDQTTLNGNNGFTVTGYGGSQWYSAPAVFLDLNGDGVKDLALGEPVIEPPNHTWNTNHQGVVSVIFGQKAGSGWNSGNWPATIDLNSLPANCCVQIGGTVAGENTGYALAAGDFNGDGVDDLAISAPAMTVNGAANAGGAYVVLGSKNAWPANMDLSTINGTNGFLVTDCTAGDYAGWVMGMGDINGDGRSELFVGAPWTSYSGNTQAGINFVLYGKKKTAYASPFNLCNL